MTWLTAPQLAGLPGLPSSRRRVLSRAQAEGWASRPRTGQGKPGLEYDSACLPPAAQQAIAANATTAAAGALRPAFAALAAGKLAKQASQSIAVAASMAQHGIALEAAGGFDPVRNPRLDVIQRFERYHAQRGLAQWPAVQEFVQIWQGGYIDAHPTTRAAYPQLPAKTLDKWLRSWRTQGVQALLERKPRADKGSTRLSTESDLYDVFVAAIAEMHSPSAQQVGRVIGQQLGAARVPPLTTLKRWIADFKRTNAPALLMFKNPDGFKNKYRPAFGSQADLITRPNQQWQLDSTIGDAMQRADLAFNCTDPESGEIRRHAIVACIDVFTRRAMVVVAPTSSANAVMAVTRQCIVAWGKPEQTKTDNGRDYTAANYDFALSSLGIEHPLCTPFSPEQKPYVERFIGTLMHDLFPMLEGFVGASVAERKGIESAKSFAQRFGLGGISVRMGARQLQAIINSWLADYHAREHSGLGCSPNAMAQRHTTSVVRIDERALDIFLMPVAGSGTRVVTKRGIPLANSWFAAGELAAYVGSSVRCRQDETDLGTMHVYALDGSYICKALDHSLLGINKGELAARAHAIQKASIQPMLDKLRKSAKKRLTRDAVQSLYVDRQTAALDAATHDEASNVHRLPLRTVEHTTPAIDSYLASLDTSAQDAARAAARATLEAEESAPPAKASVLPIAQSANASPNHRYSAWLRLSARMAAGEQLAQRDIAWAHSYAASAEHAAWHEMHEGVDPLAHTPLEGNGTPL